jgi:hypothetical protein
MTAITANPYASASHSQLIEHYLEPAERVDMTQAVRNLLPDDDRLLPAAVACAMRHTVSILIAALQAGQPQTDPVEVSDVQLGHLLIVAEGLLHIALDMRTEGMPKVPARQ